MKKIFLVILVLSLMIMGTANAAYTYQDKYIGQYSFTSSDLQPYSDPYINPPNVIFGLAAGINGELYISTFNFFGVSTDIVLVKVTNWTTSSPSYTLVDSRPLWASGRGMSANMAMDSAGNLYATYEEGGGARNFIVKYKTGGSVVSVDSTFGVNGVLSTVAGYRFPAGTSLDSAGNVFAGQLIGSTYPSFIVFSPTGAQIGTSITSYDHIRGITVNTTNNNVFTLMDPYAGANQTLLKWTGGTGSNPATYTYTTIFTGLVNGGIDSEPILVDYLNNQLVFFDNNVGGVGVLSLSNNSVVQEFNTDTVGGSVFGKEYQGLTLSRQADGIYLVLADSSTNRIVYYYAYRFAKVAPTGPISLQPGNVIALSIVTGGIGPFTWSSSDTTKVKVNPTTGSCTAIASGTATVSVVDSNGQSGTASRVVINVTPASAPLELEGTEVQNVRSQSIWYFKE